MFKYNLNCTLIFERNDFILKRFFNPGFAVLILLMVFMSISGGRFSNPLDWLMRMLLSLPAIVIGPSFHNFGQAVAA